MTVLADFHPTAIYSATDKRSIACVSVHYPFMLMQVLICRLIQVWTRHIQRKNGGSAEPPSKLELGEYYDPARLEFVPGADLDAADFAFASVLHLALAPEVLDADIDLLHRRPDQVDVG